MSSLDRRLAEWDTACPDWERRILEGRKLIPDLPLFDSEAKRGLRIFKRLRIPDIFGNPTYGEVCRDWVFDLVRAIFGSFDPETRRRMIREFFVLVPKKNGKSSIAAAIIVTAAIMNERPEAELLLIAPTKLIAEIAYKQAEGIIKLDPELLKLFWPKSHLKTIEHRLTGALIMIKAADTDVITGGKATFTLIDETHVFALKPKAAEVFVELRGALASRPDGFVLQITTQSKNQPAGVFAAELKTARDVRDGVIDLPLLPVLYELPKSVSKDEGWKDPRTWGLVNPNLGASVDEKFLRDELVKAEREGKAKLALIASQHFNVEVGVALNVDSWAGAEYWRGNDNRQISNVDRSITFESIIERSEVIVVGIDGGGLDDLLGLAVMGREKGTGDWLLWSHAWAHEIVKERRKEVAPQLEDLASAGELTFVTLPGNDVEELADLVATIDEAGLLAEEDAIGVDTFGVSDITKALTAEGRDIDEDRIVGIPQGWQLNGAIKTAERNLAGGTIRHPGLKLMDFSVGNAKVEPRGNALSITKQVSGSAKIDPLMAALHAVVLMGRSPVAKSGSYLDEEDLILI